MNVKRYILSNTHSYLYLKKKKEKINQIWVNLDFCLETIERLAALITRSKQGFFRRDRVFAVATALVTSLRNLLPEMKKRDKSYVRKIPKSI